MPTIEISPENSPNLVPPLKLTISRVTPDRTYMKHLALLPWVLPQRMLGFIHPFDEANLVEMREPFTLHYAMLYFGGMQMQVVAGGVKAAENPKVVVPFELMDPVNIRVYSCDGIIWLRDQSSRFQELFDSMLLGVLDPPVIEQPSGILRP